MRASEAVRLQPPPGWLRAYRYLGLRVPEPYRAWVAHDVGTDRGIRRLMRQRSWLLLALGASMMGYAAAHSRYAGVTGMSGAFLAQLVGPRFAGHRDRRRVLRFQRIDMDGHPVEPEGLARLSNSVAVVVSGLLLAVLIGAFVAFVELSSD